MAGSHCGPSGIPADRGWTENHRTRETGRGPAREDRRPLGAGPDTERIDYNQMARVVKAAALPRSVGEPFSRSVGATVAPTSPARICPCHRRQWTLHACRHDPASRSASGNPNEAGSPRVPVTLAGGRWVVHVRNAQHWHGETVLEISSAGAPERLPGGRRRCHRGQGIGRPVTSP